jgi:hypothetical protein
MDTNLHELGNDAGVQAELVATVGEFFYHDGFVIADKRAGGRGVVKIDNLIHALANMLEMARHFADALKLRDHSFNR